MSFELILPFLRPIESLLLADENVSRDHMGNPDASWWSERDGIMFQEQNISVRRRQATNRPRKLLPINSVRRLDEDNPLLHAQLPDGK